MSDYKDRREARRYELSEADLGLGLAFGSDGRLMVKLSAKSALSFASDGMTVNLDPETFALVKGSPWAIGLAEAPRVATPTPTIASTGQAFAVGGVYINVTGVNPATELGYGTWSAFGVGKVLVGVDTGDAAIDAAEKTTGAKTVASAGTVAAPVFTGDALATHTHTYTDVVNHIHKLTATTGTSGNFAGLTAAVDTTAGGVGATPTATNVDTVSQNPNGGVASGTTAATSAGTASGTNSAPAFTGSATSVVQPSIAVYFFKRTA